MPVVSTLQVLLPQQYSVQIPRFSARQTHLVRQKLSRAFGAQVIAAAEPGSELEGWQLGVDWAWRWGWLGVGTSWVGVAWGRGERGEVSHDITTSSNGTFL